MNRRIGPRTSSGSGKWLLWLLAGALLVTALLAMPGFRPTGAAAAPSMQRDPIPVLAHYYIWFDATSWERAKIDYPILGHYSSDESEIMRRHITWAKEAGIDGFLVSWKSTPTLNRRLDKLVEVAAEQDFKLGIVYQGLDFERNPQAADRVAADLDYFAQRYGTNSVFDIFGKPLVIWSGTWEFSRDEVAGVTGPLRSRLLILASEKNVDGYERLSGVVDGDSYYWSSVNPDSRGYQDKLDAMAASVHARGGLWIAPAAPGFDARLLGGESTIDRNDGETLRKEMDAAVKSSPDAVGLISWNEFSENTHIEPSETYGTRSLEVLADVLGGTAPVVPNFDSSEPGTTGTNYGLPVLGGLALLTFMGLAVVARRHGRKSDPPPI